MPPDPNEIHRKALRAAAAVAFGAAACSDQVTAIADSVAVAGDSTTETAVAPDSVASDTQPPDGGTVDTGDAAQPAADVAWADTVQDTVAPSDAAVDTAQAVDGSGDGTVVADASGKPDCTKAQQGGNWAQCCDELRAWCDAAFGQGSLASNECTFGKNFDGSTGCTPWGPPAPPPWPEALA